MTNAVAVDTLSLTAETFAYHRASSTLRSAIRAGDVMAAAEARDDLEAMAMNTERESIRGRALDALHTAH